MKNNDKLLQRLLRAAAIAEQSAIMPPGFDTRVLSEVRVSSNDSNGIAVYPCRAAIYALTLIALAGLYVTRTSDRNQDCPSNYNDELSERLGWASATYTMEWATAEPNACYEFFGDTCGDIDL